MLNELTQEQKDAFKEVVSIGAGNAATALSQMLQKPIYIVVPRVNLVPIASAPEIFGGAENTVTAVYLQITGDANGVILFCFQKDESNKLADLLSGLLAGKTRVLLEVGKSAIKEAATIITGAYLSALAKLLKMRLLLSVPGLAQDMAGAVIDNILIEISREADYALVADTELIILDEKAVAYLFFIPDKESLPKMLKALGMK